MPGSVGFLRCPIALVTIESYCIHGGPPLAGGCNFRITNAKPGLRRRHELARPLYRLAQRSTRKQQDAL